MTKKFLVLAMLATIVSGAALAATTLSKSDSEFLQKAAISGMFEVDASKVAAVRATKPEVKSFATMMVSDHSLANSKLKVLAAKKEVALPVVLDKDHLKKLSDLNEKKPGEDFDKAYIDMMEDGHDKAVKLFKKTSKKSKDLEIQAFATETLPTLEMHNAKVEALD